ncbi:toll/interleukin-1 receptor domain-containing protein, partial [Candidatus Bathyarchaeota archaeon]|nr:toll/interleukin-1 receptor domain-containing protein [Candidatus Bathyarchaeota archaeon]
MYHIVFISYSGKDKAVADAICGLLESHRVPCWMAPRNISPGDNFLEGIMDAIDTAQIMVLVFSGSSNVSPHVIREVTEAVNKRIIIIPFRIENIPPSKSMQYLIGIPKWLEAYAPTREKHYDELAE